MVMGTRILEHPLTFLAIDTPTRREGDVQRNLTLK
jgi:hypothetical protein